LGIDTSNYTTSVAVFDSGSGEYVHSRRLLKVKKGQGGLRQSDAVFGHTVNLPEVIDELNKRCSLSEGIAAVGVSASPRRVEGSYMPCFLCGEACAAAFASALKVPVMKFSHQEGHIMAAVCSAGAAELAEEPFCALHLSGGTTELLYVEPCGDGFKAGIIGGTKDINAGQLIDRVGLMLGMDFPCGAELDKLAASAGSCGTRIRARAENGFFNLSGFENLAKKLLEDTNDRAAAARFTLDAIACSIEAMLGTVPEKYRGLPLVFAGGVMGSRVLRERFGALENAYFASGELSGDNAVGTAMLAARSYMRNRDD